MDLQLSINKNLAEAITIAAALKAAIMKLSKSECLKGIIEDGYDIADLEEKTCDVVIALGGLIGDVLTIDTLNTCDKEFTTYISKQK